MNTRLQVEHPVTEMICGLDLVREMIRLAAGAPLGCGQSDIRFSGHAIECRITAENPDTFLPSPGRVGVYHAPGGLGVRVDSGLFSGYTVPPHYDSLIAKLIVRGDDRRQAIERMQKALQQFEIGGIATNLALQREILAHSEFAANTFNTRWLEGTFLPQFARAEG